MRKVVFVALSAFFPPLLAGLSGEPARAADLGDWRQDRSYKDEPPIYVPRYFSWTGFYIGGNLGYATGDSSSASFDGGFDAVGGEGLTVHPSGFMGGLQAGYNWQAGNFVAGVEVDLGTLGADDEDSTGTAYVDSEYGGYGALTGRLGFADDRWLFYLKGGLALANIENTASAVAGGAIVGTDFTQTEETRLGWTLGAGAEYAFHPNWSMKIEYMYMDFGDDRSGNADGDTFTHDNDLHSIKVGVNYRLQQGPAPLR
jgi:outer membrane immunogenic protein